MVDLGIAEQTARAVAAVKDVPKQRFFYMDNLKIFLIALVVIHHGAQPYGPGGGWLIDQEDPMPEINSLLVGLLFAVDSAFFMGLFFMISAYFLPGSYDRKGPEKFTKDRLIRLGVPVLIGTIAIVPTMYYLLKVKDMSFVDYYIGNLGNLNVGYLWFPTMLLIFAAGYIALRMALKGPKPQATGFPGTTKVLAFTAVMALLTFAVRIVSPMNEWSWFHIFEPGHLPQYAMLFAAGIVAYRQGWLDKIPAATAKLWSVIAVLTIVAAGVISFTLGDADFHGGLSAGGLIWSAWECLMCVSACIALLALFKNRFNGQGRIAKALADNTYTVYLVHLPVVVFLQWLLVGVAVHPLLKLLIVAAVGVPACFALSEGIRKLPYAKSVL